MAAADGYGGRVHSGLQAQLHLILMGQRLVRLVSHQAGRWRGGELKSIPDPLARFYPEGEALAGLQCAPGWPHQQCFGVSSSVTPNLYLE